MRTSHCLIGTILLAIAPLTVNAESSNSGALHVSATFRPAPPRQGAETIVVSVKDAAGKPVKAAIVKVGSSMPAMSMAGPSISAHDNGDGTYAAKTTLNFATKWSFAISATHGAQHGATVLQADVK